MPVYKKGSKGDPVMYIQKDLNSLKSKPLLKTDGIFGTNTVKSVKFFQKKVGIKIDGEVGPVTTAAIQYGGPLPELREVDYEFYGEMLASSKQYNIDMARQLANLDAATNSLDATLNKHVPVAQQMVKANAPHWKMVEKTLPRLVAIHRDFPTMRVSNPKKAAKMVKEAEKLVSISDKYIGQIKKNWEMLYSEIDQTMASISSGVKAIAQSQKGLAKHNNKSMVR